MFMVYAILVGMALGLVGGGRLSDLSGLRFRWVPLAIGGLWLAYFFRNLSAMPLLPAYDVSASEVLEPAHE